jgi:hypothetical protein
MTTHEERQRLAGMGSALRPDWNIRSIYGLLTDDPGLIRRSYRDLATAAAACWTDPDTKTPKRLTEPGPWWAATATTSTPGPIVAVTQRQPCCGGLHAPDPTGEICNPRDHERSNGRGAKAAKDALRRTT